MDRDKRWDRVEKAYRCLTAGEGQKAISWKEAIDNAYKMGKTDEFIEPTNIVTNDNPVALIKKGDAVFFYNFRIDRPRELTKAFVLENFERDANITSYDPYATKYHGSHLVEEKVLATPFERGPKIEDLFFVTMTEYEKDLPVQVAFPPRVVKIPLGRVIADHRFPQLRMAESEKERFVTFYFNGLREENFELEEHLIIPSQKVKTYDKRPEMSARDITELLVKKIAEAKHQFILVNFANADMVGHTGNLKAAIKAVSVLDECLGKIVETSLAYDATVLVTGDHGNAEEMINPKTGGPSTEHTSNLVYFIAISKEYAGRNVRLQSGILADVAPTVLGLLGIIRPTDMTGRDLLEELKV
jgi:2,3-bisphosphoglycerate-independent phosphoglycerate mutase